MKFNEKKPSSSEDASTKKMILRDRLKLGLIVGLGLVAALLIINQLTSSSKDGGQTTGGILNTITDNDDPVNPLAGKTLYVDPNSNAVRQAEIWRTAQPDNAALMDKLADQPGAKWLSNEITYDDVYGYVRAANDEGKLPVLVAYYIPDRDCSKYSSGGAMNDADYYDYIDTFAKGIGNMDAVVVLEPDALVHMQSNDPDGQPCLDDNQREMYATLMKYAIDRFKSLQSTTVYVDAGNSGWEADTTTIANLLKRVGIEKADGFSLNVSNFRETDETVKYGNDISRKVGNKNFIIDTSRNGLGVYENQANRSFNWCNPPGRALGHYPTVDTGEERVDAFLYIKNIGESDGTDPDPNKCFNGPKAGEWWPEYAAGLVQRWPQELQYNNR